MATQNNALYADCPYLHYDPSLGRAALANYPSDGFRILTRLIKITGDMENAEGESHPKYSTSAISVTFEVVGADWAMNWLSLPYRDWIRDIKGKFINSKFTLRNAPLGRFTYEPSILPWHMMLLNASLRTPLNKPDDALRLWQQGITPDWIEARVTFGLADVPFCPVIYFASIFDSGIFAKIDAVKALSSANLTKAGLRFKMPPSLKQSVQQIRNRLNRRKLEAEHLTVYDVGQGAAQALVRLNSLHVTPELYVDMGCGKNHVADAALQTLKFCTSASPPVILSHADEDHWCGAITKAMATAVYPAHKLAWTVPATAGSPAFMVFARTIWSQGGSIRTLDLTGKPPRTVTVKTQTGNLLIAQGTSKQFNYSGLLVAVTRKDNDHYWLLPGDCDYHFFPTKLRLMAGQSFCVALTAFHHGAKPMASMAIPRAASSSYKRLVYSFGCGNEHRHPTLCAADKHEAAGWTHGAAWLTSPGASLPGASSHARATAWTPTLFSVHEHAGGVLIGWSAKPPISPTVVCCAYKCAAAVPSQT